MPGYWDTILANPDFLQMLAGTGVGLGKGQDFAEAGGNALINTSKNIAGRNASQDIISALMGGAGPTSIKPATTDIATASGLENSETPTSLNGIPVQPWVREAIDKGLYTDPNSVGLTSSNVKYGPKGATLTHSVTDPSIVGKSYGANVPAEAVPATSTASAKPVGGRDFEGFFQALLG